MIDTVLGIDVSKNTLDTSFLVGTKPRSKSFANSPAGWRNLIAWLAEHEIRQVHACLEATGRYSLGIALALHEAGHVVSVVNPAQIRDFTRSKLGRNKPIRSTPPTCASSAIRRRWHGPSELLTARTPACLIKTGRGTARGPSSPRVEPVVSGALSLEDLAQAASVTIALNHDGAVSIVPSNCSISVKGVISLNQFCERQIETIIADFVDQLTSAAAT